MQSNNEITLTDSKDGPEPSVEVAVPRELGPVRLLHEIGRGGMGVVYLGRHQMLDRDVAVKFLLHAVAGPDDPSFAGFLEGARAAAGVEHPALTTIHHADVIDGIPYLVMQFIDGPALSELSRQQGPLSLPAFFAVLDAVSEAIDALHDREIVHRDIKPANVLLDREGHVFVTDFGLACSRPRAQRGQSSTGLAGTPKYMAPEMFDGVVSLRSDVYALGIMSFQLLTGKSPFSGTLDEVREKHFHQALPVELLHERGVGADLIEVIERAAHKEAMYRYKTARYFRTALRHGIAAEGVHRDDSSELQRVVARLLHKDSDAKTPVIAEQTPTSKYFARLSEIAGAKRATREPSDKADRASSPHDENADAPSLEQGDQTVEGGSDPGSPSSERARAAILVADVPCAKCDYNLRGLLADGRCPECGEALASSLRADRLLFAERRWLVGIVRGLTLVFASPLAFPLLFVGLATLSFLEVIGLGFQAVWGIAAYPSIIACVVGVFFSTAGHPQRYRGSQRRSSRWSPRAYGMLFIAGAIANDMIIYFSANNSSVLLRALIAASVLGLVVSFLLHLGSLADCIPDRQLARRCRVLMVASGVLLILGGVPWAASVAFLKTTNTMPAWVQWAADTIFGIVFLTIGLFWTQMWGYRKVVKRVITIGVSYETLFGDVPTEVALARSENDRAAK